MNTLGLSLLIKMGCVCGKEALLINERRFYLRTRLGEGGFSYVDMVEDSRTHKLFALKRITCHSKEDERIAMTEVEMMRTFNHPNLISLEESTMISVGHYSRTLDIISEVLIVMPFYRRGSLLDRTESLKKKSEHMAEDKIWQIFLGVCQGVKAMHSHNPPYAHRDIKPANVMICDDDTPVLMDLGSTAKARVTVQTSSEAHKLQDQAAERSFMLFRPPELFTIEVGSEIDERTDIWALGCLLYTMAYLESPFEKVYQQGGSIALATQSRNIQFLESMGYSKSLETMVCSLMDVDMKKRPFITKVVQDVEALSNSGPNRV